MRRFLTLISAAAIFTGLALAESWNGKLIDASCHAQAKGSKPCDATSATTSFLLDVAGKGYRLNDAGNAKAATAIKSRADRGAPAAGAVNAKVTGKMEGDTIDVETVEVP